MTPTTRPETPADREAVRRVNRLAFGRDDEADLVDALRDGGFARVSLVAEVGGEVVGHILFSELPIRTDRGTVPALALAPLAVLPGYQRRGVGSALVRAGLEACRKAGHRIVLVLGHPGFYPRFGFSAKLAEPLASPFGGGEAWMALELAPGALAGVTGRAEYPPPFGGGPAGPAPGSGEQTAVNKVNLREKFALFGDHWNPRIVGELNGQQVKLVKFRGE
ncbi:MAG TPA: GNAT family N-acetyltransferase, partial [Gemmataceae bacterium]